MNDEDSKTVFSIDDDVIENLFKGIYSIQTEGFDSYAAVRRLVKDKDILAMASAIVKNRANRFALEAKRIEIVTKEL